MHLKLGERHLRFLPSLSGAADPRVQRACRGARLRHRRRAPPGRCDPARAPCAHRALPRRGDARPAASDTSRAQATASRRRTAAPAPTQSAVIIGRAAAAAAILLVARLLRPHRGARARVAAAPAGRARRRRRARRPRGHRRRDAVSRARLAREPLVSRRARPRRDAGTHQRESRDAPHRRTAGGARHHRERVLEPGHGFPAEARRRSRLSGRDPVHRRAHERTAGPDCGGRRARRSSI